MVSPGKKLVRNKIIVGLNVYKIMNDFEQEIDRWGIDVFCKQASCLLHQELQIFIGIDVVTITAYVDICPHYLEKLASKIIV